MKTNEFDHIIRDILLDEARRQEYLASQVKENVWNSLNPPKTYSLQSLIIRVSVAACISALTAITAFWLFIPAKTEMETACSVRPARQISHNDTKNIKQAQARLIFRNQYVSLPGEVDTLLIEKTDIQIHQIHDTLFIRQDPVNMASTSSGDDFELLRITQNEQTLPKRSLFRWLIPKTNNNADIPEPKKTGRLPIHIRL